MVVDSDGEDDIGRPKYTRAPEPRWNPADAGGEGSGGTAREAYSAIVHASFSWIIPVYGGIWTIRRANKALHVIADSGGALDGVAMAIWARRLGWFYIAAWAYVIFQFVISILASI